MAKLLRANGSIEDIYPANGQSFTLPEMQQMVGGFVEVIHLMDGHGLIVNEEGWLAELPFNAQASLLHGVMPIVGDVVLCNRQEIS